MASNIDISIPRAGNADTARVRAQFSVIKTEIEALQESISVISAALDAGMSLPDTAVQISQLATVALSGSYFHLAHRPSIPSDAEDVGALPIHGGTLLGPLTLAGNADTALGAVSLQQLNAALSALAAVARSGSYLDLVDKPALGTAAATDIDAYATAAQGGKADTAVQPVQLAPVATSGAYSDLAGKPALGTAAATDIDAYATAVQGGKADTAVQPSQLAPVATSGDFASLSGALTESQLDAALAAKVNNTLPYKVDANRPPRADDGQDAGWQVGSLWVDIQAGEAYRCVSNVPGSAVWAKTTLTSDELSNVALSGNYADLVGKPTLGTAAATDSNAYATAAQGSKADTAVQPGQLARVATSGAYADLAGKPALGTAAATNATAYATAQQGAKADTAVQPSQLAAVATSGAYIDLKGRPSALSQFTNDLGLITGDDVPASPVTSVNGRQGDVVLAATDVGATPSSHAGSGGSAHAVVTTSSAGFMAATDKVKLNSIEPGAQANAVSSVNGKRGEVSLTYSDVGAASAGHAHSAAATNAAGFMSAADKSKLNGIEPGATADQTPQEILAAIKTVDGSGSGLDADLLDGQDSAYYRNAANLSSGTVPDSRLPARLGPLAQSITDWNTAISNGWYMSSTATNSPQPSVWFLGHAENHGAAGWCTQTVHGFSSDSELDTKTYRRELNNGTWGQWYRLRLSEREQSALYLLKNDRAGLLDRANHTGEQAISTVAGLLDALNAKAEKPHTHAAGDLTGLSKVATSGNYADLLGKPETPTTSVLPPVNVLPLAAITGPDPALPIELHASAFAALRTDVHAASQWQISADPDFSTIAYDSGEVTA